MAETADQPLNRARALEAEAFHEGEESARGRELLAQAADLRVRGLGARIYPVVVCAGCLRVTGWTDTAGTCDRCLQRARRRAAYSDPHAGWVSMADTRPTAASSPGPPLKDRLAALIGLRSGLEHGADREWLALVDPGETGPTSPETGYEIEVAKREQAPTLDGSGDLLLRFSTATYHFAGASWQRLETTRIGSRDLLAPAEFSAGLPIEQLAEAWGDFGIAVHAFNGQIWWQQAETRETARQIHQAQEESLRQQQDVAELLHEDR